MRGVRIRTRVSSRKAESRWLSIGARNFVWNSLRNAGFSRRPCFVFRNYPTGVRATARSTIDEALSSEIAAAVDAAMADEELLKKKYV